MSVSPWPARGPLPARQAEMLALIDDALASDGRFPTLATLTRAMGWKNEASARDCLDRLVWRGKLTRARNSAGALYWSRANETGAQPAT